MRHNNTNKASRSSRNRLQIATFVLLLVLVGLVLSEPLHQEVSARLTGVRGGEPVAVTNSPENGWGTLFSWDNPDGQLEVSSHANSTVWKPTIMFGYDGIGDEPDPEFLSDHVSWLMIKSGMDDFRDEVEKAGFKGRLLQYQTTFQILGPGPYKDATEDCDNDYTPVNNNPMWTDDFCELVHEHEDWFLHNGKGERLYIRKDNWDGKWIYGYYMNPASEGFRTFWVDQFKRQRNDQEWKAIFLDNVAIDYNYLRRRPNNQDGTVQEFDSTAEWQEAMRGLLKHMRQALPDVEFWGNMIEGPIKENGWDFAYDLLDGFQEERFATSWLARDRLTAAEWNTMLKRIERTLGKGKRVAMIAQGEENDLDRMRFAFASYLLVATEDNRAYFRYAYSREYHEFWWYPEYMLNLGPPLGARYQKEGQWMRDFACGRVAVNPATFQTSIELRTCTSS